MGTAEVERGELAQEGTDFRGGNVGIVGDGHEFVADGIKGTQHMEALPSGGSSENVRRSSGHAQYAFSNEQETL